MLSSKHLLERTGISRATLNNYIVLGLLPRPTVKHPGQDAKAPRLGYFEESAVDLVKRVGELKRQGLSMAKIAEIMGPTGPRPAAPVQTAKPAIPDDPGGAIAGDREDLTGLLARRDEVTAESPSPFLTQLAILTADLQDSSRLCAELPPEEYFVLVEEIQATMAPHLHRFGAITGKHPSDGLVCFFLPQPGSDNYLLNAIACAHALQTAMAERSLKWQRRKNWLNKLFLNIALHGGEEWFGVYRTTSGIEVRVLGESVNESIRLARFSRDGAIWCTKKMVTKLPPGDRNRIRYGVRRTDSDGHKVIMANSYARIADLINLDSLNNKQLAAIAAMPVTEILELMPESGKQE